MCEKNTESDVLRVTWDGDTKSLSEEVTSE